MSPAKWQPICLGLNVLNQMKYSLLSAHYSNISGRQGTILATAALAVRMQAIHDMYVTSSKNFSNTSNDISITINDIT